jgi:non-heme chloroperoxidase
MASVEVDGVSLFWAERGKGAPVVFVHGIPTDYRAWDNQVGVISKGFRTITYSRRYAHPNSRAGDLSDSTIENNANDLAGLISKVGPAPVHLVGHSYGGFIAAYLATRRPALVRTLTLVEPAIAPLLLRDPNNRADQLRLLLRHPRVALSAQRFLRRSNGPALAALARNDLPAAVRFNLDGVEDRSGVLDLLPEGVRAMMLDNARTVKETSTPFPPLSRRELGELRLPTLVIHGETSALWLRTIAIFAGQSIPGSKTVMIPNAGHYSHFQNPTAFNAALQTFLRQAPP